ncbi:MAG TPA: cytochrome b/b6 domain-containing protein [Bacteroidales bacterium]|jgi:thiosulfate reductase cytochrome b subunit|nr:hypothetical protein [Bacteroidales bacterium]OQB59623.1 MAG: hypothetical protein BWX96_02654 [Bacteroidetes bacterium ADurb.Bin145]NMD01712.1 hypothetical protein [Bacteroidales bacterium]HOU03294.1 cytochrome b/b6 domain-containing protein [Bacteroidales bacterium]HQG63013.1 cytochrome b/b6 domain-containing protein [Bacteroidales bacterium]
MYLYPLWIRLWHLINALAVVILIVTGLSMFLAGNSATQLFDEASKAARWHNVSAAILTISYLFFVTGNIISENGKYYKIRKGTFFSDLTGQLKYYLCDMFRGKKDPFRATFEQKFNPLQKITYIVTMYIALPLLIISGVGLMLPEKTLNSLFGLNSLVVTDILHIIIGFFIVLFLAIHIFLSTLAPGSPSGLSGIITGYKRTNEE